MLVEGLLNVTVLHTVVLKCFTCPAITVATVTLWALDRVRGRVLGWLGPGSPKSQPGVGRISKRDLEFEGKRKEFF